MLTTFGGAGAATRHPPCHGKVGCGPSDLCKHRLAAAPPSGVVAAEATTLQLFDTPSRASNQSFVNSSWRTAMPRIQKTSCESTKITSRKYWFLSIILAALQKNMLTKNEKGSQISVRPCELRIDFMSFFETVHSIGPKSEGARFGGSCVLFSEETLCKEGF